MDIKNAFEHVELTIKFKRREDETAREVAAHPNYSNAGRANKLAVAKFVDEEVEALCLVLELARKQVAGVTK